MLSQTEASGSVSASVSAMAVLVLLLLICQNVYLPHYCFNGLNGLNVTVSTMPVVFEVEHS